MTNKEIILYNEAYASVNRAADLLTKVWRESMDENEFNASIDTNKLHESMDLIYDAWFLMFRLDARLLRKPKRFRK